MPNLFANGSLEEVTLKEDTPIKLKKTYAIDFQTGEFIKNPDGSIKLLNEFDSYIQWCQKALMTARYKYAAYSDLYGKDIIGSSLDKKAMELEIKRVTREALMVHPFTKSVDSFSFDWRNGEVYYFYEITTLDNQTKMLTNTEKVG
ncbi:DUF2634 domain-containing protein [Clostridium senegalense]|uniref:DUF2634 domain-containing protein n=1 Tax=Clostridium senegalense TaxID=1465809 RepID=UPI001C116044|nr:DUF2634 domain-containing protein [Clostridium senegalense]MBU5227862.1 DUF2634 domain-containing protein [Clostridium senegalense]